MSDRQGLLGHCGNGCKRPVFLKYSTTFLWATSRQNLSIAVEEWDHITANMKYGRGYPEVPMWNEVLFIKGQRKIGLRNCEFINPDDGQIAAENIAGRSQSPPFYVQALYYKPRGFPDGVYRVGPLARINVADQFGTPLADVELKDFRQRFGHPAHSVFLYHYARLLEIIHAFEKIEMLLADWQIPDKQVRATGSVNSLEEVGMIEAPAPFSSITTK
jgi:hypothetical protein